MFRILTSMLFILTHSVLAQASGFNGSYRVDTQKWVASYAGETEVDGLPVTVSLEEARSSLGIPEIMVGASSLVPTETAPVQRSFRLSLIVSHNPAIRTSYVIRPRTVSVDGALRLAYVSELDQRGFQFLATVQPDSTVLVSYTRKTATGGSLTGQIVLSPVPRVLAK